MNNAELIQISVRTIKNIDEIEAKLLKYLKEPHNMSCGVSEVQIANRVEMISVSLQWFRDIEEL